MGERRSQGGNKGAYDHSQWTAANRRPEMEVGRSSLGKEKKMKVEHENGYFLMCVFIILIERGQQTRYSFH